MKLAPASTSVTSTVPSLREIEILRCGGASVSAADDDNAARASERDPSWRRSRPTPPQVPRRPTRARIRAAARSALAADSFLRDLCAANQPATRSDLFVRVAFRELRHDGSAALAGLEFLHFRDEIVLRLSGKRGDRARAHAAGSVATRTGCGEIAGRVCAGAFALQAVRARQQPTPTAHAALQCGSPTRNGRFLIATD